MEEGRRSDADHPTTDEATGRRLSVAEAAETLGISGDAVRSRIKRGTLETVREGGRVFVVGGRTADRPTAQAHPTDRASEERLYQEMQARIAYLERQVEEEREARRRADTLLARLMDRMPEIEAPQEEQEARESSEAVEDAPERAEPRPAAGEAQEGVQRPQERSWWRRMFGG